MKYEDLPDDIKADIPQYLQDIINKVKTYAQAVAEIQARLNG
jgi:cation transport regulator ChaB